MSDAPKVLNQGPLKKRLVIMAALNVVAILAAGAMLLGYLKMGQGWALPGFIAAMGVGFGAQIWFIAGLRQPAPSGDLSARQTRANGGA